MAITLTLAVLSWAPAGVGFAQDTAPPTGAELLARGFAAYDRGLAGAEHEDRLASFMEARLTFEKVVAEGTQSADLLVDLGNAALLAEQLGPAILAYRQALDRDPDHRRARQNLAHARHLLPAWVPRPSTGGVLDTFFFWHQRLARGERLWAAVLCFAAAAILLAAAIRWRRGGLRALAMIPLLAWVALVASVVVETSASGPPAAVLTADETTGRAADAPQAPSRFAEPLPGGTECQVVEVRGTWARIALADGREAWVPGSSVARVRSLQQ